MRYLFGLMLTLLPLNGYTADSLPFSQDVIEQTTVERSNTEVPSGNEEVDDHSWPYSNPYHPASTTNFDRFVARISPLWDENDRSRMSRYISDSGPPSSLYGHFGSPFFPDSISRRNETDHPYALDSPTNHFGRTWFIEKR